MDADVLDERGACVRDEVGEFVVRSPWPGHDTRLLEGRRPLPGHVLVTISRRLGARRLGRDRLDDDLWYIRGRSDDTIKLAGKRFGPSEVESALVADPASPRLRRSGFPMP